jgi:glycerol-3-phosphate O-acyltransferase
MLKEIIENNKLTMVF